MKMIKKLSPSLSSLESDGNTSFLRAARAGHLDKVLEHLKQNIDINTSNSNGLNALHLASKDGHVEVVKELLSRGAAVDAATKKGNTALHIASLAGQEEVVKLLIQNGASVNVQSQNGFTPLYMAAQENHDNVVKYLLANGANQSLATEDGFTPLAVAMQQGHEKVVTVLLENDTRGKVRLPALHIAAKKDDVKAAKLLLENDHNPDVTSKSGFTPLHIASHYGNESIANLLIQKGADVNYAAKHNISPLHVAAKWGKTNMVAILIEKGANIESKTRDGLTPLHCAARSGHEQVVDMLLEKGAPISSKTKNGLAPLHMAAQGDHVDAARILLYHRAPVDEVTVDYLTALHVAAHCGHVRVAKLLLDRGADANARALNGFTPLHIACKKNRIKVVELLLKHGASIEATTESGLTPLHVASFMGCMNIVIYLLQHNANPDVPTVRGETPLHLAARANQTDIIRILLRNGANVDARAREQQTPLHIASRLGNVDIVMLLLQHGAKVDTATKDMYTALHIASKEGQDEVAAILIDNGASINAVTKKGFTSLHLASKYGHMKVAKLLLQKEAAVDAQGKNGVTPLHVASHYDHQNVALLLLDKGASPHAAAKNGHTPLHIAAKKNQMDIANTLLEYGADPNTESKAGFTPLHLSAQEGHDDMSSLLLEHKADPNSQAKNGLTPIHLCAQEDRVPVAEVLAKAGADVDCQTKSGYTPLHIACHYGQINMVRFLINKGASVKSATNLGYTPLHQAAQQGHTIIVNILLKNKAPPNAVTVNGQTPLSIAQKLGYISVIETLKVVTETTVTTTTVTTIEEKYRVVAPEAMQETFMSDSEEEGGEDTVLADHAYRYLTADEMKSLGDDSLPIDVTRDEKIDSNKMATSADSNTLPPQAIDESISPQHINQDFIDYARKYTADNMDILKQPINIGFLVSFLVDARGGAMRGCRHSGVRIIVPPQCAASPTRITCRYVRPQRTPHPPPLMEGEALASRVLELGPVGAKFLGPVIIEVPHFAALRGKEREIVILRSDNGETWREHTIEAADEIMNDVLNKSFEEDDLNQLEDPSSGRITRIVTNDFPQYFAVVTRIHQEVHAIGPEGGMVSSTVVPQVQAVFPQGALTKKIKVGLQAQPIDPELTAKLLGHGVAVSPVVTVEPRRRKFHKAITLSMPAPRAHSQGMINQYSGSAPTLRLLCSITGGTTRAQWEDVTGSTPLTFVNDCVSFTTTVSARFWLMDCRNIGDATKMATELYREAIHVPFMAKFVVFAKRVDPLEARLRVFCMTDDKEDKTLEQQEHFTEVAKSRDVEVLEGKPQYIEFSGNLVPITKSGEQLQFSFRAFRENRLPFSVRVKDQHAEAIGRCLFMREPKVAKGDPPQQPICILNIVLPDDIVADTISLTDTDSYKKSGFLQDEFEYYMPDPRISDMSNLLGEDWVPLAAKLGLTTSEINVIKSEYPDSVAKQAQSMLRMWRAQTGHRGHSNILESALKAIGREDIIQHCLRLQQSNIPRKEGQITDKIYYEKENIIKEIENEIIRTKVIKEDDYKKDENYETKYSAEEKAIEESDDEETFKKSVIERRHVIERKMSSDRTAPSSQRIEIVQEISTIKSLVEDKVAEAEEKQKTIIIKPYTAKSKFDDLEAKKIHDDMTNKQIDLKNQRDEKLLEGVSQRLEEEEKLTSICTNDDPYSPKSSKTPPPSPADFILKERASAIQEKDKADVPQQQQQNVQTKIEKTGLAFESTNENQQTIFNDLSYVKTKTLEFIDNETKFEPPLNAESATEKIEKKKHKKGLLGTLKMIVGKSSDSESEPESIVKTKVEKKKTKESRYNKKYSHGKKPRMPTPPPELSAEEVTSNDENDLPKTEKPIEKNKEKEILTKTVQPPVEQQADGKSKDHDKTKEHEERKTGFFNLFTKKEKRESLHSDQIYSKEFKELLQKTKTFVDTELNNYECGESKQPLQIKKDEKVVSSAKEQEERKTKDYDKTKESEERKTSFFNLFSKKEKKDSLHSDETYSKEFKELLQNTKNFVDNELNNYESGKPKQVFQTKQGEIIPSAKESEERKTGFFNLFSKKEKQDSLHDDETYSKEFTEMLSKTKTFVDNELNNYECEKPREVGPVEVKKDEITPSTKETEERKVNFFNLFTKKEKHHLLHGDEAYTEEFKELLQKTKSFVDNEFQNYECEPTDKQHLQIKNKVNTIPTENITKEVDVKKPKESESTLTKKHEITPSSKETEEKKIGFFNLFGKKEKRDSLHGDEAYTEEFKELLQNTKSFVDNEFQNYECEPADKHHLQIKKEVNTIPTESITKEVDVKKPKESESTQPRKHEITPSSKETEEKKIGFFNLFGKKEKLDSLPGDEAYTEEFKELLQKTKSFVDNEFQNYECEPTDKQHLQIKKEVNTIPTENITKEVDVKKPKESESTQTKKHEITPSSKETEEGKIGFFNLFSKKEKRDSLHGDEAYTEEFKELLQNTKSFVDNEFQNYECEPADKHHLQIKKEVITIPTEKITKQVDVKKPKESESVCTKKDDVTPSTKESEEQKSSFFNLFGKKEKRDSLHGDEAYTEEFKELLQNTKSFVDNEFQNYECEPADKQHLQSRTEKIITPIKRNIEKVDVKELKESESIHTKKDDVTPSSKESEERKVSFLNLFGKKEKLDSLPGDEAYTEEFKELLQKTKLFVDNEFQNYEREPIDKQHIQAKKVVITIPSEKITKEIDVKELKESESAQPKTDEIIPSSNENEERKISFFNLFSKKEKRDSLPGDQAYSEEFKELLQKTKSFVDNEFQSYEREPIEKQHLRGKNEIITIPTEKIINEDDVKEDVSQLDTTKVTAIDDKHAVVKRKADKDKTRATEQRKSGFFGLFGKKDKKGATKAEQQLEKEIIVQTPESETIKLKKEEIDLLDKDAEVQKYNKPETQNISELVKSPISIAPVQQTRPSVELVQSEDEKMESQKTEKLENVASVEKKLFKEDDQSVEQKKSGFFSLFGKKEKKETPKLDRKDVQCDTSIDEQPSQKEEEAKDFKLLLDKTTSFLNTELTNYEVPLPKSEKSNDKIEIDLQDKRINENIESVEEDIYEEQEYPSIEKQKFEKYRTSFTEKLDDHAKATDDGDITEKEPLTEKQKELPEKQTDLPEKQTELPKKQEIDATQSDLVTLLKETTTFINTEIAFRSSEIPPKSEQLLTPVKEKSAETIQTELATASEDDSKSQSSRESSPKKAGFLSLFTKKAKKDKAHKSKSKESEKGVIDSETPDRLSVTDPVVQTKIDENKEIAKKDIIIENGSGQKEIITDIKTLEAEQIAARQAINDTHSFLTEEQLASADTVTSSISKPAVSKEFPLKEQEFDDILNALAPENVYVDQETIVNFNAIKRDIEDQNVPDLEVFVKPIHVATEQLTEEVQSIRKEIKEEIKPQEEALMSQLVQEHKDLDKKQEPRSKSPKKDSEDRKSGIFSFFGKKSKTKSEHEQTVDVESNLKDVLRDTNDFISSECLHYDKPEESEETTEHREIAPKSVTFSLDEANKEDEAEATKVTNGECTTDASITSKDSELNENEKGSEEKKSRFLGGLFGKKDKKHKKSKETKEEVPPEDLLNSELIKKGSTTETYLQNSEHIVEKDALLKEANIPDSTDFDKKDEVFLKTLASTKSFLDTENQNYDDSPNIQMPQKPTQYNEEHEEKGKHGGILKIITDKISKISPSKSSKTDTIKKPTDDLTLLKDFEIEETEKDIVPTKIDDVESLTTKFKQLKDKTEETKDEISGMVKTFKNIRNENTFEKDANEVGQDLIEKIDNIQGECSLKIKQIDSTMDKQLDKTENLVGVTATTITDNINDQINNVHDYSKETFENLKKEFEKVKESATDEFLQGKIEGMKDEYSRNLNEVSSELLDTAQGTVSSVRDNATQQAKKVDEDVKDIRTEYLKSAAELDSIINEHLNISENLKQISSNISDKVEYEVQKSDDFLHEIVQDSTRMPSNIDSAIEQQLHSVKNTAQTSAITIGDKIEKQKQDLKETLESIKTTVDDKTEDISKVLKTDEKLKETIPEIGSLISHTVKEKMDTLDDVIQKAKDKIPTETISTISDRIVDKGTELTEGIQQSIGETLKQTKESINDKIKGSQKSIAQEIEMPFHDTKQEVEKYLHKVQETGTNLIEQDKWKEVQDLKEQFEQKLEEIPQIELKTTISDKVDVFEGELKQVKDKGKDIHDTTQDTLVHFQEEFIKDFKPTQLIEKEQPHKVLPQVYVSPKSSKKLSKEPDITNKESEVNKLSAMKSEIEDSVSLIQKSLAELEVKSEGLASIGREPEATTPSQSTQKRKPMFRLESEDEDVNTAADIKGFDFPKYTMETLHEQHLELKDKETKSIDEKLENIDKALQSLEDIEQMHTDKTTEPKLHRVERKFERMASEILEKEAEEAKKGAVTNEELENKREKEFNRFVSQISTEEMSIFQNEYSSLCTEEIDSLLVDADVGSPGSQDNFKGDVVYMAPVKFNENNSINKAGIEVNVIPIMRSHCTSPLPLPKPDQNLSRPQSDLGFYSIKKKKGGSSLPDLQRSSESLYSSNSGIVESILEIGPENFLTLPPPKYARTASEECLNSENRVNSNPKPYDSNDCLSGSLTKAVTSWLSQSSLFSDESKLSTDSENNLHNKNRETTKKSRKQNSKRQPCTLISSPLGESSDHPQSTATTKEPDAAAKGEESKQSKEGKKEKQAVKDQHKLSEEMEELLEAMKETGKK